MYLNIWKVCLPNSSYTKSFWLVLLPLKVVCKTVNALFIYTEDAYAFQPKCAHYHNNVIGYRNLRFIVISVCWKEHMSWHWLVCKHYFTSSTRQCHIRFVSVQYTIYDGHASRLVLEYTIFELFSNNCVQLFTLSNSKERFPITNNSCNRQ